MKRETQKQIDHEAIELMSEKISSDTPTRKTTPLQEWIKDQREKQGRTYKWIADKLWVSRQTVWAWSKGGSVGELNIIRVSEITGIPSDDLIK